MTNSKNWETLSLAKFVAELSYADIPQEVIEKIKLHLLDGIGNQISGSTTEESNKVVQLVKRMGIMEGSGNVTMIGHSETTSAPMAALTNGTMAHAIEMDDAHRDSLTKAGSVLVPAAVAVAESEKTSGEELLLSLICGYEVMVRIGLAMNPGHRRRGFHSTGTIGAFGAAVSTAKLLNLNTEQTAHAMGIAGTQAAGLVAFLDHPCMIKGFNAGKGAFNGVIAGYLASEGFTGPINILEGSEGFCQAYSDEVNLSQIVNDFGNPLKIKEMGFKPHAACRYAHGPIDAMVEIVDGRQVTSDEIEEVNIWTSPLAIRQSNIPEPTTLLAAQGSTNYSVALAMHNGKSNLRINDFKEIWGNENVMDISRKVKMSPDEESYGFMGRGCKVEVKWKNGKIHQAELELPKGEPENPVSASDLKDKFESLAEPVIGKQICQQTYEKVMEIDEMANIQEITTALRTGIAVS